MKINLNADIGEGFGAYDIGNDAELMTVIRSASVACGLHAGDANTMHRLAMLAREGFADRHYEDDGNLSPRSIPGTVFKDPDKALAQCLGMVRDRCLTSRLGKKVNVEVETICVHGDEPTAVNVARHVRQGLEAAGCRVVTIPEMMG